MYVCNELSCFIRKEELKSRILGNFVLTQLFCWAAYILWPDSLLYNLLWTENPHTEWLSLISEWKTRGRESCPVGMDRLLGFYTFRISSGLSLDNSERKNNPHGSPEDTQTHKKTTECWRLLTKLAESCKNFIFLLFNFYIYLFSYLYVCAFIHIGGGGQFRGASTPSQAYGAQQSNSGRHTWKQVLFFLLAEPSCCPYSPW